MTTGRPPLLLTTCIVTDCVRTASMACR